MSRDYKLFIQVQKKMDKRYNQALCDMRYYLKQVTGIQTWSPDVTVRRGGDLGPVHREPGPCTYTGAITGAMHRGRGQEPVQKSVGLYSEVQCIMGNVHMGPPCGQTDRHD